MDFWRKRKSGERRWKGDPWHLINFFTWFTWFNEPVLHLVNLVLLFHLAHQVYFGSLGILEFFGQCGLWSLSNRDGNEHLLERLHDDETLNTTHCDWGFAAFANVVDLLSCYGSSSLWHENSNLENMSTINFEKVEELLRDIWESLK